MNGDVSALIAQMKSEWGRPRAVIHDGKVAPFPLTCRFDSEPAAEIPDSLSAVPDDLKEFWRIAKGATLFKDETFGQWGLKVLDPAEAVRVTAHQLAIRPGDFSASDLVIGRFLG